MKKYLLFVLLAILPILFYGQNNNTQVNKKETMNFYEIQKNFNNYWAPYQVKNGKYITKSGEKVKAPGWKPFKRWEWFWESRINLKTGEFPQTTAWREFQKYQTKKLNPKGNTKSDNSNWINLGTSTSDGGYAGLGRLNCVAFHPTDNNTFWTGSPSGGLWKTTNGGSSWTVLTDNNTVLGVSDIAIPTDYATSNTIYIATGDRDGGSMWSIGGSSNDNNSVGVLKSTDGGISWNTTGLSYTVDQEYLVSRLLIDPDDNQTIFAATTKGVYKTTNGGTDWTKLASNDFIDMEFNPGDKQIMYGSTKGYSSTRIYKSTDGGSSWSQTQYISGRRTELAISPAQPTWVYAIAANSSGGLEGIYKSTDSGDSFFKVYNGSDTDHNMLGYYSNGSGGSSGQGSYDLCIAVKPDNANTLYVGGVNGWKSNDGGASWSCVNMWTGYSGYNMNGADVVHADKHFLSFQNNSTLFECNDGGIYKTTNGGSTWTDLTNGIVISQIYRLGVSQMDSNEVICGLQDNGTKLYSSTSWSDVKGGDGMECIIDYTDNNVQYGTYVNGEIERTTNHWGWGGTIISNNISDENGGYWVTPYIIDPNNNQTLYVGYADVWKTTDRGNNFTKISTMNSGQKLRSMAIAPSNNQVLYVADKYYVWKTTNGGTDWTNITGTLYTGSSITYLAVKNDDPNTVWVTFGGYNSDHVYESVDGGNSWNNISSGLPNLPVMSIVQNKQNTFAVELYAGADIGVYRKVGTADWELFSTGLPNVVVTELDIYYDDANHEKSKLRAATYGRGLWETTFSAAIFCAFSANNNNICIDSSTVFTDNSSGTVETYSWNFGDGASPATANTAGPHTVTYSTVGQKTVSLTVTGPEGNDTETKVDYITVSQQAVGGTATCDVDSICEDNSATVNLSGYLGTILWQQSNDNVNWSDISGATSEVITTPLITEDTYFKAKLSTDYNEAYSNAVKISVKYSAIGGIATCDVNSVCESNSVTINLSGYLGTILWQQSNDNVNWSDISGATTAPFTTPLITEDTYFKAKLSNDCSETYSSAIQINVKLFPVAEFNYNVDQRLVNFIDNSQNGETYFWNFGDGSTSTEQQPSHSYVSNNDYSVLQKVMSVCGSDSITKQITISAVGINEIGTNEIVTVYPNPNNGTFLIKYSSEEVGTIVIKLYNIEGKLMFLKNYEKQTKVFSRDFNFQQFSKGIYQLRIIGLKTVTNKRVLIR